MKHKIKRLIRKMACFLFVFMYAIGWVMAYAFLAFLIFGAAADGFVILISAIAGGASGSLLWLYILKN